jgi:PH (Pleckstrin Homology) domain-containing protein
VLVRKTTFVPLDNVGDLSLKASPVQLLFGLATLVFGLPKNKPRAIDLDRELAEQRFDRLGDALIRSPIPAKAK